MNKLLYFGANIHIDPIIHFKNVNEFIMVDTQPRSEFDNVYCDNLQFYEGFYRPDFYIKLIIKCISLGFVLKKTTVLDPNYFTSLLTEEQSKQYTLSNSELELDIFLPKHVNPTLLEFYNEQTYQKIKYYISTNLKLNKPAELITDIESVNGIIISGHWPQKVVLDYIHKPIIFYGYTNTCFQVNFEEIDMDELDLMSYLYLNKDLYTKYFNLYYLIDKKDDKQIGIYTTLEKLKDASKIIEI